MKKVFILIAIIFSIMFIIFRIYWGNTYYSTIFSGTIQKSGIEQAVKIEVNRKNADKIFNTASGNVLVVDENHKQYEYTFSGEVFEFEEEKYYAAPVYRKSDFGLESQGYLFYDNGMKNIVIETTVENVYSANGAFIEKIKKK